MDIKVSQRVAKIKPSPTLTVTAKAAALKAKGKDIISLSAGEPDFDTPEHIKEAAIQALKSGYTKYTPVAGSPELIQAVIKKFKNENNLDYTKKQILVSCGCKHSLYNMAQALLNHDDEVIIPAPYWVSYPDIVRLAGATPVVIKTGLDQNFKIKKDQLLGAINDNTRLLILNSPSNPTGAHYSVSELEMIGEVLRDYPDIVVASDDIYEHILWGRDRFENILNVCPELKSRTLIFNGVSKAYSMTGWRIGYAAGPESIIKAMSNIQSQSTSNPTSIAQAATVAALEGDQSYIEQSTAEFKQRHDFVLEQLNAMQGIECAASEGTFYIFPDVSAAIENLKAIKDDVQFAEFLLEKAGIAVVPGSAFGAQGYIRISFATSMENLEKAMERLSNVLKK